MNLTEQLLPNFGGDWLHRITGSNSRPEVLSGRLSKGILIVNHIVDENHLNNFKLLYKFGQGFQLSENEII